MRYSERITTMQSSPIRKLAPIASSAKAKGIKIYHLTIVHTSSSGVKHG